MGESLPPRSTAVKHSTTPPTPIVAMALKNEYGLGIASYGAQWADVTVG